MRHKPKENFILPHRPPLTKREMDVFQCLSIGHNSLVIASAMGISRKTADVHKQNIKGKLGLKSQRELLVLAIQWGKKYLE